eukprot:m.99409 g.99409  ORF g.99409 m.99409 type:complete len:307 (+) comp27158_c0_seq1:238-1158(+)
MLHVISIVCALLLFATNASSERDLEALVGLAWDVVAPPTSLGVVKIEPATGSITMLAALGTETFDITEATYDKQLSVFYLLPHGDTLRPFFVNNNTFGPDVMLDTSPCSGGDGCFQELHAWHGAIYAIGLGWKEKVAVVRIDVTTGGVTTVGPPMSIDTAIVTDASALDPTSGVLYATVVFPEQAKTGASTVIRYNVNQGVRLPDMLVEQERSPNAIHTLFCTPRGSLFAFDAGEHVVRVLPNQTSVLSKDNVKGIPATHGAAATNVEVWVSVINMAKRSLTRVDLTTGAVSEIELAVSIQHLFQL